jgi:Phosphate-selective porin O and P
MMLLKPKWATLLGSALALASVSVADDNKALLDALVRKGLLTNDEAAQISAEVSKGKPASASMIVPGSKYVSKLTLSGRFQIQYAGLTTNIENGPDPVSAQHFFLRRMYFGAKAEMGKGWSGVLNYDFAGSTFDAAFVEWKHSDAFALDIGFRKVPFGYEETTSSGSLRAIERSPATRYFVEGNNGRRLGAGSYRTGLFAGGKQDMFFYNVAITNPERDESASGVTSAGNRTNNNLAYWANGGIANKFDGGDYRVGVEVGLLPDQGGKTLGTGNDLTVYGIFADVNFGKVNLQAEWMGSKNDQGASALRDSEGYAYWIQPSYKMGDFEAVVRYTYVDSDLRGVDLGDGIRSAPGGGTMDKMSEWFVGGNWYIRGNDVKLQLGFIHGESEDSLAGTHAKAQTNGIRSQMQLNF